MRSLHSVLLALGICVAFVGVQACATETPGAELNPQPLPPEDKKDQNTSEEARNPGEYDDGTGGGSTSSSGGAPSAGVNGDGGDAGTDSGGDN